jgi:hypothetical protein
MNSERDAILKSKMTKIDPKTDLKSAKSALKTNILKSKVTKVSKEPEIHNSVVWKSPKKETPQKKETSLNLYGKQIDQKRTALNDSISKVRDMFENNVELNQAELKVKKAIEHYNEVKKKITDSTSFKTEHEKIGNLNKELNQIMQVAFQYFLTEKQRILDDHSLSQEDKMKAIHHLQTELTENLFTKEERDIFNQLISGNMVIISGMPMVNTLSC